MPHQKHAKYNRTTANRADANNNANGHEVNNNNVNGQAQPARVRVAGQRLLKCCVPGVQCFFKEEMIDTENAGDAVRVSCNNEACDVGNWMHKSCFDDWEQTVLSYLRSCGRARSWSEKQRLQNLWTKKGYDLAFKACDCSCGKGHLRKDLDYIAPPNFDNGKKKVHKKKTTTKPAKPELTNVNNGARERRSSGGGGAQHANILNNNGPVAVTKGPINANSNPGNAVRKVDNANHRKVDNANLGTIRKTTPSISILNNRNEDRFRANSISSTGSSPPTSASPCNSGSESPEPVTPSPQSRAVIRVPVKPSSGSADHSSNPNTAAVSLFRKRQDLSAFNILPKHKQNPYHIKMEDDALIGNDDVHTFILNHLSSYKMATLNCVLCKNELSIFDSYPLLDGTLFLSPQAYDNQALRVISEGRLQFINAVCVTCLEGGNDIRCAGCKRKWDGSALLLGSMYSYDIFAAMPCCQKRLTCKQCRRAVVDFASGLPYFSEYSHMIPCPYCKAYDYHFIRPLCETFAIKMSIWQ